jgi:isocitrate/isopropylmalate dehydrogenase
MIGHLGRRDLRPILGAIERVVATGQTLTPDLGGSASTRDVADAVTLEISR